MSDLSWAILWTALVAISVVLLMRYVIGPWAERAYERFVQRSRRDKE